MGCSYYLDIRQCREDPEENNYNDFVSKESTRKAIHVGDVPFGAQSGAVYNALTEDIMKSQRFNVEFLLEHYPVIKSQITCSTRASSLLNWTFNS